MTLRSRFRALSKFVTQDWARNSSGSVRLFLASYRLMQLNDSAQLPRALRLVSYAPLWALHKILVISQGGGRIPIQLEVGPGLKLPYGLLGTVIAADASIGSNATIYQQVTIGSTGKRDGKHLAPMIGDNVVIFPGAKLLGPITIGEGAIIGAGSLVMDEVPPGGLAVATKGKIVPNEARALKPLP